MDAELDGHDERIFHVWRRSPTVHSSDLTELKLAFKIALALEAPGSKVLKAFRRHPTTPEEILRRVEEFVANDPDLTFVEENGQRRIRLLESREHSDAAERVS